MDLWYVHFFFFVFFSHVKRSCPLDDWSWLTILVSLFGLAILLLRLFPFIGKSSGLIIVSFFWLTLKRPIGDIGCDTLEIGVQKYIGVSKRAHGSQHGLNVAQNGLSKECRASKRITWLIRANH